MKHRYLSVLVGIILLSLLDFGGVLRDKTGNGFQDPAPKEEVSASQLKFQEASKAHGIDFVHRQWFPNPSISYNSLIMLAIYPSTSVYDVDDNGVPDILYTDPHPSGGMRLFVNNAGKFHDATKEYGLDVANQTPGISRAVFADFNRDGKADLVVARMGCHEIFLGGGPRQPFRRVDGALRSYCSNVVGLNVGDFDRDGNLDIFFSTYWHEGDLKNEVPESPRLRTTRAMQTGGKRLIMKGNGDGSFEMTSWLDFLPRSYSNNVGVSDIDGNGWLDLYIANDYSYDFLVLNKGGGRFEEATDEWAPKKDHGLNGMNADFGDFNRDGRLDLYVSNISAPPYASFNNILWVNRGDRFEDQSRNLGVAHCGWSWSAKWGDFDNDGQLDLVVANGRARGAGATAEDARSVWHDRVLGRDVPAVFRSYYHGLDYPNMRGKHLSGFARSCLFRQNRGRFWDVAPSAGISDLEEGYGLSLIDIDNDGRLDFTIANLAGPVVLYHNETVNPNGRWIGFKLEGPPGLRDPFGALVELELGNGKKVVSMFYPTNGFNSQSDTRVHFGLTAEEQPVVVRVSWPTLAKSASENIETFTDLKLNAYQTLRFGTAGK